VWERRSRKPLRVLPDEEEESLREDDGVALEVQLPAPPRPTWYMFPFAMLSRLAWRSSSSSKENIARSETLRIFPAPPLPLANLLLLAGRPCSKREAGPVAMLPVVVFGALKVLPAPPRPECAYFATDGCGSVIW
jgi:hypothetical protein